MLPGDFGSLTLTIGVLAVPSLMVIYSEFVETKAFFFFFFGI